MIAKSSGSLADKYNLSLNTPKIQSQPTEDSYLSSVNNKTEIEKKSINKAKLGIIASLALATTITVALALKGKTKPQQLKEEIVKLSEPAQNLKEEISKIYDDLIEHVGLKNKPVINYSGSIELNKEIGDSALGLYTHALNKIDLDVETPTQLYYVIFKPKDSLSQIQVPKDKFNGLRLSNFNQVCEAKENPEKVIEFMKKYRVNPEEYEVVFEKLEGEALKAQVAKSLMHELRHSYQKELIHRYYGFDEVINIELKATIRLFTEKTGKIPNDQEITQLRKGLEDGFAAWKKVPVEKSPDAEEAKLAKKFLDDFKAVSEKKVSYENDPFEKDAYGYESSKDVIDFLASKFNISESFKKALYL
jgi:hypothetical protein